MPTSNHQASSPKLYSAPRQFDLATLLVVTSAYAILFAGMKALNFSAVPFGIIAGFVTSVGLAQSLFSNWNHPRLVSFICGMLFYASCAAYEIVEIGHNPYIGSLVYGMILSGGFMGYFCGIFVGGVFLVSDFTRTTFLGSAPIREHEQDDTAEESPWHSDD